MIVIVGKIKERWGIICEFNFVSIVYFFKLNCMIVFL